MKTTNGTHVKSPEWHEEQYRKKFNTDARVIKARKQYKDDLKLGVPEGIAWSSLQRVIKEVNSELKPTNLA
jgi:hypothetical protein